MRSRSPSSRLTVAALAVAAAASPLAGCADEDAGASSPSSSAPSATSRTPRPTPTATPAPLPRGAIDPTSLPAGPAPTVDHVVGRTVRFDGQTLETDLPADVAASIMGSVDGRVVLAGQLPQDVGAHYWAVDETGHAQPLGDGAYESYTHPPGLVEETGHIWTYFSDRGTGREWIWEIDVRTGEELLELRNGEDPPTDLAPADQAVLDVYRGGGDFPQDPATVSSPDGSLETVLRESGEDAEPRHTVVVRRTADDEVVRTIDFALGAELADLDARLGTCLAPKRRCSVYVSVGTPSWEDDEHLLVPVGLVTQDRRYLQADVEEDVVVRCDLEGACERATDLVGSVSLGVDPGF
ncbi:hypothetical protein [Nocardioides sp.]|uniref:hypothetical protein n=1 Tax=Nocardioides sp. TaxID=35761 RepID=UPI00271A7906|nr:hypothetical protein [Nocardioides sp.]MDO9455500.1 hypothetical protein [Nocardioides sp.]